MRVRRHPLAMRIRVRVLLILLIFFRLAMGVDAPIPIFAAYPDINNVPMQTTREGDRQFNSIHEQQETATTAQFVVENFDIDWLYKKAMMNDWYKWVHYTGQQVGQDNCYTCTRAMHETLFIINTRYNWAMCQKQIEDWVKKCDPRCGHLGPYLKQNCTEICARSLGFMGTFQYNLQRPSCGAECLMMLGSRQYTHLLQHTDTPSAITQECLNMDVRLTSHSGKMAVPQGMHLWLDKHYECFEKKGGVEVGESPVELCDYVWLINDKCSNDTIGKYAKLLKGTQTVPSAKTCPYHYQNQAVADHYWLCDSTTLRSVLPLDWKGRCARVQAVMEVVMFKNTNSVIGQHLHRTKITYKQDPKVWIDRIGQPRGIPEEFKARNEIAAGFECLRWILSI